MGGTQGWADVAKNLIFIIFMTNNKFCFDRGGYQTPCLEVFAFEAKSAILRTSGGESLSAKESSADGWDDWTE